MLLSDVMDDLGTALETIPGLRVFPYWADQVAPPAAVISWPSITYDATMARGSDRMEFQIAVAVGKVDIRSSRDVMSKYADGAGTHSVKAAILDHPATAYDSARVSEADVEVTSVNSVDYLTATFTVQIFGPGKGPVAPARNYVFSTENLSGSVTQNTFLSLVNPAGSGKIVKITGVFISATANASSTSTNPMRAIRATNVTGGNLRPASDIGKFVSSDPDPLAEVRTSAPQVTAGARLLNSPPPTSPGAYSSGFVHQIPTTGFTLVEGEGIALRTGAGDTAQRWNISVTWSEQ